MASPAKQIPISDLLLRRRPTSATSSLSPRLQPRPPFSTTTKPPNPNPTPNPNSNPKILKSLPEPSILIGTLSLPSINQPPPLQSYFSFSDGTGSVCCDVIRFDFAMIGRKIHVLSWNYIPLTKCSGAGGRGGGGLLEIIKWRFFDCLDDSDCAKFDSFSLGFSVDEVCCDSKIKYSVDGVVKSVSPVVSVPCVMDKNGGEAESVKGFIVEVMKSDNSDDFVYFSGALSMWHPAFLRLVGRGILLSRLRKKLVYISKEGGRLMYVASEVTRLCFTRLEEKNVAGRKSERCGEGKGELGVYIGVVKGVYLQGMVIELDEDVWLLVTEKSLAFTCSVRVGSVLQVRNVHIVNPKFRWSKMLVLGACSKTNITTISFSPWETGCHMVSQSQSLLRKFICSLSFPAQLWVLSVMQCFRKKFSGLFSEKEILGTNHKEGLVQTYARSFLPSSVFQLRHGLFMEFCKHDSCNTDTNISYDDFNLVAPLSNILGNCDRVWSSSLLELKGGLKAFEDCSQADHPFSGNKLPEEPIRRMLPSKDIGISLVGNLKVSQDSGRLQFTDATGCIDAVIPDLPLDCNMNVIFEVVDYTLVLEGRPGLWGQTWVLGDDLFSLSSIFCPVPSERQTKLTVYVHFQWSNVKCGHFPSHHCPNSGDSSIELDNGIFHLLCLVHKFPLQPQFHGESLMSDSCRVFAEAMVLPWDLHVVSGDNDACPEFSSKDEKESCSHNGFAFKRCKTHHASSDTDKTGLCSNSAYFGNSSSNDLSYFPSLPHKTRNLHNLSSASPFQIPCTVSVRRTQSVAAAGNVCYTNGAAHPASFYPTNCMRLLLEFNSKNMLKYKMMHIGIYYIMKHLNGRCFCESRDRNMGNKVAINMETHLWSTSFYFNEGGSSYMSRSSSKRHRQNELLLHPDSATNESFYDVSLHLATDVQGCQDVGVEALKEALAALSTSSASVSIQGQQVGSTNSVVGNFQNQVVAFGNSLSDGNLISLRGIVASLQCSGDETLDDVNLSRHKKGSICLLVLINSQKCQIGGCLSKYNYPVGLTSGADVTFHRILALSGQNRFILTPVSFVTVHTIKEALPDLYSCFSVREETIPSSSITDLIQSDTCKPKRLRCRVVGVYILILERHKILDKLLCHARTTIGNIPLAGFIMDDGSSRCFCWASGERAATFLRLHDNTPEAGRGNNYGRLKDSVVGTSCSTSNFHLNKILKKHGRVAVKNFGSIHDTFDQEVHLYNGSKFISSPEDKNLLKSIIFSACSSTFWSITAHLMDSNSVDMLEKFLTEEQMTVHALQNVWARDVSQVDTLMEARASFQELKPVNYSDV